jgi:hypothetical protein
MTLSELREQLEAATGADRELDAQLAVAVDPEWREEYEPTDRYGDGGFVQSRERPHHIRSAPDYTASIDAALGLIERRLNVHCIAVESSPQSDHPSGNKACASIHLMGGGSSGRVAGKTPALALISALLAALEGGNLKGEGQ